MASNMSNATNYAEVVALIPMLKEAKNYEFWSLKMKTMFKSQELWDLVENGFEDNRTKEPDRPLREKRKKDAKVLFLIQQALHDEIFPLIAATTTSTQAWDVLKRQYLGDKKVTRKEEEKTEIEEETSIDVGHSDVGDFGAPEKKEGSGEQAAAKANAEKKDGKKEFENVDLVVETLFITLTYQGLLNPPSTFFKHSTEIDWECIFSLMNFKTLNMIRKYKNCPAALPFSFLFLNTMIFLQEIIHVFSTFQCHYRFAVWFSIPPLVLCYSLLLTAFSYDTAYVAVPLYWITVFLLAAVHVRERFQEYTSRLL